MIGWEIRRLSVAAALREVYRVRSYDFAAGSYLGPGTAGDNQYRQDDHRYYNSQEILIEYFPLYLLHQAPRAGILHVTLIQHYMCT